MSFKFVAINGDDVGGKIGGAIASDNHEELSKITGNLKEAHGKIEEWVEGKGGEVITSAGDECIFKIPADSYDFDEVESLKDEYANQSGHSATIGIGDSMSEASKALIYGKMNEKDQVVEYDGHIDDYIADYDDEDEDETLDDEQEEKEDLDEAEETQENMDQDEDEDGQEDGDYEENSFDQDENMEDEESDSELQEEDYDEDETDEYEHPLTGDSPNQETDEDLPGEEDESLMEEGEINEEDVDVDPEEELKDFTNEVPEHEAHLSPEEKEMHDSTELMSDDEEIAQEQAAKEAMGEDTEEINAPADHLDGDYGSEEMADAQPPHEQSMSEEEEFIHDAKENRDDELDADAIEADMEAAYGVEDHPGEEEDEYQDMTDESQDRNSALQNMIHANLDDEEGGDVSPADQEASEELKQNIASTLVAFKENRQMLERLRSENPKAYQAQIAMLENMIEMAKLLNMNPEQDAEKMQAMSTMPGADEQPEEEVEGSPEDKLIQKFEKATESIKSYMKDIKKARVDEGKSKEVKQKLRSKRNKNFGYSKEHSEKGVNKPDYARIGSKGGESEAGNRATGFGDIHNKSGKQKAKESHLKTISEQKRMKKPDLPKSEEDTLKKKALKKAPKDPKSLPDKATKHKPKKQLPIGATKGGKVKVKDGETGKVSWRSGRSGMKRDWDGDPIARNYNRADAKERKTHTVHMGRRSKK